MMQQFLEEKIFSCFEALILAFLALPLCGGLYVALVPQVAEEPSATQTEESQEESTAPSLEELYQIAMLDAMVVEDDEIQPLVVIDQDSDLVTWDEEGQRVLLLTWNDTPNYFVEGEEIQPPFGEIWAFTDAEIAAWYQNQEVEDIDDWVLRLEQLIGLPAGTAYTHVAGLWVYPDDIIRPAYQTDITLDSMSNQLDDTVDDSYRSWFESNVYFSYFQSAYPWTRLGYTYDWADNGTDYGLSEFLISAEALIEVDFVMSTEAFVDWMARQ